MAPIAGSDGSPLASAHRVIWFDVNRPVTGTVFVKPAPVAEVSEQRGEAAYSDD